MKSRVLAISAIASAFTAIALIMGAYISIVDLFSLVIASVFVILPLYYKSYKGCLLTFLAGGVIALLCALSTITFTIVFPAYAAFFGLYPIARHFASEKKVNKIVIYVVGLIWCVAAVYGIYFFYTAVMGLSFNDLPLWIANNIYYFLAVLGIAFYIIYDRFVIVVKIFLDRVLGRIIK